MCTYKEIRGQDNVGYKTIIKCALQTVHRNTKEGGRAELEALGETLMAETQWDSRWMELEKIRFYLKKIKYKKIRVLLLL